MDSSTAIQSNPPLPVSTAKETSPSPKKKPPRNIFLRVLDGVASLKVTVALFALSLILVFLGTLAQVEIGIWDAVRIYFRSIYVLIPLKTLSWYTISPDSRFANLSVPFPGGWLLGGLLMTNLIAAHVVRFQLKWNRAGIVILHFGIILMMLGEFFTGMYAVESTMLIREGETVNFVQDNRTPELAVIDATDPNRAQDDIIAMYLPALQKGKVDNADLPFDVEVLEYHENSKLVKQGLTDAKNIATQGQAKGYAIEKQPLSSGTDAAKVDTPSAMVRLTAKDGKDLGTYLVSFRLDERDTVKVGDKSYEIALRPKRDYRDYTIYLQKAEENKHPNLEMAKDYSSYILLDDPAHGVTKRPVRIYMNAPMRYRGEAFFQANMYHLEGGEMMTGLQVVRNELHLPLLGSVPFWMLPYISCLVVAAGMLVHFGVNLFGFLKLQARAL